MILKDIYKKHDFLKWWDIINTSEVPLFPYYTKSFFLSELNIYLEGFF
jgi:hypothetical protein